MLPISAISRAKMIIIMWVQAKGLQSYWVTLTAALAAFSLAACHKAQPPDAVCSYETLPANVEVPSGQGAVETLASTDTYFSVRRNPAKSHRLLPRFGTATCFARFLLSCPILLKRQASTMELLQQELMLRCP